VTDGELPIVERVAPDDEQPEPGRRRFARIRAAVGRIPRPSFHTRRGRFIALILVAGFGSALTVAGVTAVSWTETADFCGRCHTMDPELKAYAMSAHREVPCAECHVEPGAVGWVKAKINGTRQLIGVLTGTFPTPIPAPDHADLPPTSATCIRCHDPKTLVANGGPVKLVIQEKFREDEPNTKDTIALVLRPAGFGTPSLARGVHWHIDSEVDYIAADTRAQTIDYVAIKEAGGEAEEFIASSQVTTASDVQPDIERLSAGGDLRRMDCIDCHNRAGHGVPTPDQAIDDSLSNGTISDDLPYVKREGVDRLTADYASVEDADRAIAGLRTFYAARYPLVNRLQGQKVDAAITKLQAIYRLVATPDMKVTGTTYPNNLGHQSAPGCFRCHDGAHYKVVDGALTKETIPSACATCHTFPQIGATESGVLIGQRPASHDDRLWVFSHKSSVNALDPAGTTCGACHTRTYCESCHDTAAVKVKHQDMMFNHAAVIAETGYQACAYCHQPAYCAQCHADPVLPDPFPHPAPSPSASTSTSPTPSVPP
jgi:nitrate/TMAO reductase-like tetraheme cytochrome c subunit